ncbi:noroxomaritidine synthase 2-like [Magnolia sinica]|uniref:noroxomaritidine synthase 2-like n=1 Tax=Magnolia sinica TaxID=86752 RepID=UPI002659F599|nr:noroxomaritidine synthase 2-like [Magnolia sinica]
MSSPWFMDLWSFLQCSYPEIIIAVAVFFLVRSITNKDTVLVNWPIVGMLPYLLLNVNQLHDWYTEVLRSCGCTILFKGPWFARMDMLITCDPDNVNHILNTTNFSNYPKGDDFSEIFEILGDGILNADYESWRIQRKMAHSLVRYKRFRRFVVKACREKVENGLVPLLSHIAHQVHAVDLQDVLQRFTFDVTCLLVCGTDPGCLSADFPTIPFAKAVDDAKEVILLRHTVPTSWWKLMRWLNVGGEKTLTDAKETIDQFIHQQISARRDELKTAKKIIEEGDEEEAMDLLSSYMDYQHGDEMDRLKSDTFLRDTTLNMLVAGRDTTSAALTWFFWVLSKNPKVETKILEELRSISLEKDGLIRGKKPRVFDPEDLGGMVYLHAALCESLRLFSPVPLVHKGVLEPDVLPSGIKVQPGMKILYSLFAMGRMESIWGKDCLEFRPERWISEGGMPKFSFSDRFLVFNAGPRSCLGKDISFVQMKAVAAAMLYNYEIQVLDDQVVAPRISVILHMKNGLMVNIRERCA